MNNPENKLRDVVPSTLEQAVELIVGSMDEATKEKIRNGATHAHHGSGTAFRNGWSLWDVTTPLSIHFQATYGLCHGDDLSGMIFAAVWGQVRGETFDPHAEAQRYKDHWQRMGYDPMQEIRKQ